MTLDEIKDYQDNLGKWINLFGYTSCSLKKDAAMKFMWQNQDSGHHKVLFHILWDVTYSHYYLNAGAYDHEEEILLNDGARVSITAIDVVKDSKCKFLYILISLESLSI